MSPPPQHPSIWAAFCLLSPWSLVLVLFCCRLFFLLRSRREITHSGERKNSTGSTWMLWLIFSFSLKEDNSQGWRGALEKVSVALRSLDIAARPQQTAKRVYRVLFAVYSLLNASCSLIRHKFILSKPLLSHSSHTASQSTPPSFRPFTAPSFFLSPFPPAVMGRGVRPIHFPWITLLLSAPQVSAVQFFTMGHWESQRKFPAPKVSFTFPPFVFQCVRQSVTQSLLSEKTLCKLRSRFFLLLWIDSQKR